jgi:hypothetical protein
VSIPTQASPRRSAAAELATKLAVLQGRRHAWELDRVAAPAELAEHDLSLLLGASGSGKSTVLAAMAASGVGVYVQARELAHSGTLGERLAAWARSASGIQIPDGALEEAFAAGELRLLLDGLDELPTSQQADLSRSLAAAVAGNRLRHATVASRWAPKLLPINCMRQVSCPRLDPAEITRLAESSPLRRALSPSELGIIRSISAGKPLLVELLCNKLATGSELSWQPVDLLMWSVLTALSDCTAGTEESSEQLAKPLRACSQLALEVVLSSTANLHEERVAEALSPLLSDVAVERVISHPLLFRRYDTDRIDFRHRLIAEFLSALAIHDEPRWLTTAADFGNAPEAIGFALEMAADPTASLIALGEHSSVHELQRFAPSIARLPQMQRDRARVVLVEQLRRAFTASEAPAPTPLRAHDEEIYFEPPPQELVQPWPSRLLDDWRELENPALTSHEKGQLLEDFMARFFGMFFTVRRDIRTPSAQIDLLLEVIKIEPFWNDYGALVPVECKNRKGRAKSGHIRDFVGAIGPSDTRLAFFVSRSGFTRDALEEIRPRRGAVLLVPITGAQIVNALEDHTEPAQFFTAIVRNARFGVYR